MRLQWCSLLLLYCNLTSGVLMRHGTLLSLSSHGRLMANMLSRSSRPGMRGVTAHSQGSLAFDPRAIRAISLDVTGTLLVHKYPIMDTYAAAAVWARLPNPPTAEELKPAFKKAYYKHLTESPSFGHSKGMSGRSDARRSF